MTDRALDALFQQAGGRVIAALAARFRNLDLAEDAFQEACVRALSAWQQGPPADAGAWLYATARRVALDQLRRAEVRTRLRPEAPPPEPTPEEMAMQREETDLPDERLRLIFICCHPAVAPESRAALTLRLVCGVSTDRIAGAFLISEPTLLQRLTRAKRKIAEAGVPFEMPRPAHWPERLDAVLSTLEVAYAQAYQDAAGCGPHAGFAQEMLALSGLLAERVANDAEVLALAATLRFAEARRRARLDVDGAMLPLSRQDPAEWDEALMVEAERLLNRAAAVGRAPGPRALQAAIHAVHAARRRTGRIEWGAILGLYDALLQWRDDPVIRVNRAVALAEVQGPQAGLAALSALDVARLSTWLPYRAAEAALLQRAGRLAEAAQAFQAALALNPEEAERLYLQAQLRACG